MRLKAPHCGLVQLNEKTFDEVSLITITSPLGITTLGDVHDKTASPELNVKELLLNSLSVK